MHDAPTSTLVSLRGLSVRFANGTAALDGVDLDLARHEFVSIVGPSGCGKSTLLRVAAGLQAPTAGAAAVAGLPPGRARREQHATGYVFQFPTLLPWRTVAENVGLPLELEGRADPAAVADRLDLVGLREFAGHRPRELSGGMQMRVSLARALVTRPDLLLLDEPFGALDEITRQRLNEDLLALWARDRWAALFVTHNVTEAAFLGGRVLVMTARPGRIAAEFAVPFPHPRPAALRADPAFARLAGEIGAALREAAA